MTVWIAFAVGILVGWIVEWIIDWLFWRRNLSASYATESRLRNELAASESKVAALTAANNILRNDLGHARATHPAAAPETLETEEIVSDGPRRDDPIPHSPELARPESGEAKGEVASTDVAAPVASDEAQLPGESGSPSAPAHADDLTKIDGIGPVYRRKLREAGISTFARLAAATPQEVTAAINPGGLQKPAFEQWIADAAKLAGNG